MSVRLNSHLSDKQLAELRDRLLGEGERIRTNFQLKKHEYEHNSITGAKDEVDSANDNILLAADMRFSNRESLYYKKIMKTLSKVESDQYGMCDECGDPITYSRLIARPTSEMCILCKEESEREENQNFYERRSKSLGREMSVAGN
jgi:DnaK suppressor protein